MKTVKKNFAPGASDDLSTVIDHGQDGLNPNKSFPVQLTFGLSIAALVVTLLVTLYYYGVFS
jgi:hypothetical protein